ncbi:MAG: hypothetical protein ACP5G0_04425 [Desulfomonilia bacterium]
MSKYIKCLLVAVLCSVLVFSGCTTDKLIKKEDFSLEQEKSTASPPVPRRDIAPEERVEIIESSPLEGKIITLTAREASFSDVFSAIAESAELDLVIDSRLISTDKIAPQGESSQQDQEDNETKEKSLDNLIVLPMVSLGFTDTPLSTALDNLVRSLNVFYEIRDGILFVKATESRIYHLNFLSSQKETKITVGGDVLGNTMLSDTGKSPLSGEFSINDKTPVTSTDIYSQIDEVLKSCMTRYGTYSINRALGFLEVRDMRDAIERIDAYITTIKTFYNAQVVITAKILEVSLNDESKYGIDWTSIHGNIGDYVFNPIQQRLALPTDTLVPALEIQVQSDKHGFEAVMNALEEYGNVKVLTNPRVRVTNGQPALISVGTSSSYIQEIKVTTTTTEGGTSITTPEVTIGSIFDGIMLGVVPNIDLDTNSVNLSITPIKSRIVNLMERSISDNIYTLPVVDLEEALTQIRVRSGDIVVLGGLISKNITHESTSIPILGDIPYLGYLFSQKIKGVESNELVIMLEPVILEN